MRADVCKNSLPLPRYMLTLPLPNVAKRIDFKPYKVYIYMLRLIRIRFRLSSEKIQAPKKNTLLFNGTVSNFKLMKHKRN